MTDRELLKEARDLIVMCSLLDKSGQCESMADKIDKQLSIANVVNRRELLLAYSEWWDKKYSPSRLDFHRQKDIDRFLSQ